VAQVLQTQQQMQALKDHQEIHQYFLRSALRAVEEQVGAQQILHSGD
jgi:hypothetical protein